MPRPPTGRRPPPPARLRRYRRSAHLSVPVACRLSYAPRVASDDDWPAELDALVAAAAHHSLVLENEHVRVLDTHIGPGETTPVHTHRWPAVLYVVSGGDFVRRDADGNVLATGPLTPGDAVWSAAFPPHSLENAGRTEIRTINVELKRA